MSHHLLYNSNGIVFWSEEEIRVRNMIVDHLVAAMRRSLLSMNQAFKLVQVEAPLITPRSLINPSYNDDDFYGLNYDPGHDQDYCKADHIALRPETTMGSYVYAKHLISGYHDPKFKLPICVWQHGKSFRKEQDQATKFMRLKEFYQLEFQILFAPSTANDYYPQVVKDVQQAITELTTSVYTAPSDRLPNYSTETTDIIDHATQTEPAMELCSISRRTDFEGAKNIEVAVGTDRVLFKFMRKRGMFDLR